jgi:ABC-2 type transport system permease protein
MSEKQTPKLERPRRRPRIINSFAREAKASYAFVERNFNLVKRYINWEIVFLAYTIVNTLTIGLIAVGHAGPERVLYLVVGALLWSYLSVLFEVVSEDVAWERWEGTIEYTFMAPVSRLTRLGGTCFFAALYGLLRTAIVLGAVVLFFDLSLAGANIGAFMVVLASSSFAFMGLGIIAAVLPLISPEKGAQATHIIQAIILLVSGVYYEIDVLPAWLRPMSYVSPATYTLRASRAALLEGAGLNELWPEILILLGMGVVLIPLGLWVFGLAERHAKRTGKLKRSG